MKNSLKKQMINNKVFKDYRNNILIDKNNPVLAFKANRDRYSRNGKQDIYAGLPHIGSLNSEDAITWNYIRSLCLTNDVSSLENLLELKLLNPKVLLWTLSFEDNSNELQYLVGSIIRAIDGKYKGQITKPDIIIETDDLFIVFECKLGEYGNYPNHLWGCSSNTQGPIIRYKDYFEDNSLFKGETGYYDLTYQLFRMAFYTDKIGYDLNKKPVLISLTNKSWWEKKRNNSDSPKNLWWGFTKQINESIIELKNVFWQDIKIDNNEELKFYLKNHRCLTYQDASNIS